MNHPEPTGPSQVSEKQEVRLITCVLHKKTGVELLKGLHRRGLNATEIHRARGSAIGDPVSFSGLARTFEKEIVTVVVPAAMADEVFEYIAETAGVDRPHGGFLYMERLGRCVPYVLPDLPEEDST